MPAMDGGLTTSLMLIGVPIAGAIAVGVWVWLGTPKSERSTSIRRQGGGFMGAAFDEVFHPDAKAARQVWEAETELPAPAPSPGDPPTLDLDAGRITLMLPEEDTVTR